MQLDDDLRLFYKVFLPDYLREVEEVHKENKRFVYYTSAEVVSNILSEGKIWLRNVSTMNDFSEISYGIEIMNSALDGDIGVLFEEAVNDVFPNTYQKIIDLTNKWIMDWKNSTYITCVSVHDEEDSDGRLSMWRAYGDTAIVINNTPLLQTTNLLPVYSAPVRYLDKQDYENILLETVEALKVNREKLAELGEENLIAGIHKVFFITAITTKHPGFKEEKEWRIYYRPNESFNDLLKPLHVIVDGVPQQIYQLPLEHKPEKGLYKADIPSLLDRIIIGPSEYSQVAENAYHKLLEKCGVENPADKVHISCIPLRTR